MTEAAYAGGAPHILSEDLFKIYKIADLEVVALRGLDLRVQKGEVVAIVGASGSGKSTLLNILAGYDTPSAGQVTVGERNLLRMGGREVEQYRRYEVGFVWQQTGRNLFPYLTAIENVVLPMMLTNQNGDVRQGRAKEILELVGLSGRMGHRPAEMSGGEQQRVAIAVALANRPPLLLADEPTGELDDATAGEILDLFSSINREFRTTILIVSHDPDIAHKVGRVVLIRDGKMSAGDPAEDHLPARFGRWRLQGTLGGVRADRCERQGADPARVPGRPQNLGAGPHLPGRRQRDHSSREFPELTQLRPLITTIDVSRTYNLGSEEVNAVKGVSITVLPGPVHNPGREVRIGQDLASQPHGRTGPGHLGAACSSKAGTCRR